MGCGVGGRYSGTCTVAVTPGAAGAGKTTYRSSATASSTSTHASATRRKAESLSPQEPLKVR